MCDPITLLYITAGSAAASAVSSIQAGKATQKQYQAEARKAEIQNIRSVRQQIREARLSQAAMTNVAAQTGAMGSSALAGGVSSVGAQLAGNVSYMSDIARENTAIGAAASEAAGYQSQAALFGAVGSIAGTIFEARGGFKALTKPTGTPQ